MKRSRFTDEQKAHVLAQAGGLPGELLDRLG